MGQTPSKAKAQKSHVSKESETPPCIAEPAVLKLGSDAVHSVVKKAKEALEQEEYLPEIEVLSALQALENVGELSTEILRSTMIGKTVNLLTRSAVSSKI